MVCIEKFVYCLMLTSLSYKLKYSGSPKLSIIFYWKVFVSNFKRTHIKAFPGYLEKYTYVEVYVALCKLGCASLVQYV